MDTGERSLKPRNEGFSSPADPAKLARAILQLANAAEPPLRLPLGQDDKNIFVERETAKWRAPAESTVLARIIRLGPSQVDVFKFDVVIRFRTSNPI